MEGYIMKSTDLKIVKYEADEGKVFDYKESRYSVNENGEREQEHLYAKTIFIGANDSIENYIEVDAQV